LVAGVLVYIERAGEVPSRASLEALGEGRRVATHLGAVLGAFCAVPEAADQEAFADLLGAAGADRAFLSLSDRFSEPAQWDLHGEAFASACKQLEPRLILIPATADGRGLAPRLAARLDAAFAADAAIEFEPTGEVIVSRGAPHRQTVRRLSLTKLDRVAVATLAPGTCAPTAGHARDVEIAFLPGRHPASEPVATCQWRHDSDHALERATIVVTAGGGITTTEELALVRKLARALGAELAGTRTLCQRGLLSPRREVGIGARHVFPRLYVSCAASGSAAHLDAVGRGAKVVAIDRDPDAAVFRRATYGMVGAVADVIPALIEALR
jgi:electron transfer flavoprotein alpha subunit